jgi:hypothetical protein
MTSDSFIDRHGLWSDAQIIRAAEVMRQAEAEGLHLVRLAWADPMAPHAQRPSPRARSATR